MFNKLKNKAMSAGVDKIAAQLNPILEPVLGKIQGASPKMLNDDNQYKTLIVSPAYQSVNASIAGVGSLIPGFQEKFETLLLRIRGELFSIADSGVSITDGAAAKLPEIILSTLKG